MNCQDCSTPRKRPLSYFDDLRNQTSDASVASSGQNSTFIVLNDGEIRLGHLVSLLIISSDPAEGETARQVRQGTLDVEIAAFLGMHHFNQRSGAVIHDLPGRLDGCNVYFTMDFRDSYGTPRQSTTQLLQSLNSYRGETNPFPTGIVGTGRSSTAAPTSVLGGVFQVPQVSCCATSRALGTTNSPLLARTVPINSEDARAAAAHLKYLGVVHHVGVLYVQGTYGQDFATDFRRAAEEIGVTVVLSGYDQSDPGSIDTAIERLKTANMRYFLGIFFQDNLARVMKSADKAGVIGPGYTWLFSESLNRLTGNSFSFDAKNDAAVIKGINGSGVVLLHVPPSDAFDQAIRDFRADKELQDYFVSRHINPELFDGYNLSETDSFRSIFFAQLNYDASIALGIAACEAEAQMPTGQDIYETMLGATFQGSSGPVQFQRETGSRSFRGLKFEIHNIRALPPDQNGEVLVKAVVAEVVDFLADEHVQSVQPFLYADGSTSPPSDLPEVSVDLNEIPTPVIASGYALCAILMLVSVFWIWWTLHFRRNRTVQSAQPFFLVLVCVGAFIMSSSIIPMGFQEPMPQRVLDVGCMATPWLFSLGFTTSFSALSAKLWRIGRLHKASVAFQRVTIRPRDAVMPFLILLTANLVILIAFTIISPLRWTRSPRKGMIDLFGRSISTYGSCTGDVDATGTACLAALVTVNLLSLFVAIVQSYLTRKLPSMFNESSYVAMSLLSMFEASLLGIPLFWLVGEDPTAFYLVQAVLVCIFCLATILPIFIPKARIAKAVGSNSRTTRFSLVPTDSIPTTGHFADNSSASNLRQQRRGAVNYG